MNALSFSLSQLLSRPSIVTIAIEWRKQREAKRSLWHFYERIRGSSLEGSVGKATEGHDEGRTPVEKPRGNAWKLDVRAARVSTSR